MIIIVSHTAGMGIEGEKDNLAAIAKKGQGCWNYFPFYAEDKYGKPKFTIRSF